MLSIKVSQEILVLDGILQSSFVFLNLTLNSNNRGLQAFESILLSLTFKHLGGLSVLLLLLGGVVINHELDQLVLVFLQLPAREVKSVSSLVFTDFKVFNFFLNSVVG